MTSKQAVGALSREHKQTSIEKYETELWLQKIFL